MEQSILEKLNSLSTLKKKQTFLKSKLAVVGVGTARIVYEFGNNVLKLAKDNRGIAQNEEEYKVGSKNNKLFTIVYDAAPDFSWLVVEKAKPCTTSAFETIYGIPYDDFYAFMLCLELNIKPGQNPRRLSEDLISKKFKVAMIDVFVAWHQYKSTGNAALNKYKLSNKCGNFLTRCYQYKMSHPEFVIEELITPENMGIVERNGKLSAVIIDPGMNEEILFNLYDGR